MRIVHINQLMFMRTEIVKAGCQKEKLNCCIYTYILRIFNLSFKRLYGILKTKVREKENSYYARIFNKKISWIYFCENV